MDAIELYTTHTETIDAHYEALKATIEKSGVTPEGNCLYFHESFNVFPQLINKRANLLYLASKIPPYARIAEIGLNAGHSAVLLTILRGDSEIVFFDLCEHPYVRDCFAYLRAAFPTNRMRLIDGDSRTTLPLFSSTHVDEYDLVHVDGGHQKEVFANDLECAIRMLKIGGVLIADDTNIDYISELCDVKVSIGILSEVKDLLYTVGYTHRIFKRVR